MPAPITKAPSLRNAKKPSGRSPRGSKQASPRVARGQVGSPRSVDEEPLRPQSRWDFPTQQLMEIQSRVHDLERLVTDYEALQSEVESLPASTRWSSEQVRAAVGSPGSVASSRDASPERSQPPPRGPPPRPGRPADAAPERRADAAPRPRDGAAAAAPSRTYPVAPVEEPKLPPRVVSLAPAKDEKYVAKAKNLGAYRCDKRRYTAAHYDDLASTSSA